MQKSFLPSHIAVFSKLRRDIFSSFNRNDIFDQNIIDLNIVRDQISYIDNDNNKRNKNDSNGNNTERLSHDIEGYKDNILDDRNEGVNIIPYNLIKVNYFYGVNLNVDIFILKSSNIVFFLQNVINIYNPLIKSLRTVFTKHNYVITCSYLFKESLVVVLYSPSGYSCIQIYCIEKQTLTEEISLKDYDYYEKVYVQKENNYFLLITNKSILKVLDSEKKDFIFSIYLQLEYSNILQYYDFFLILRKKKLYLWNLERTYTGLKIKEKSLELDEKFHINCFCVYKKYIFIGTSNGCIFLWEELIEKKEIQNENYEEHDHKDISYIHYYDNYITTKEGDFLKLWECKFNLENIGQCSKLTIKLEKEIRISININKIISHDSFFLIVDKKNSTIYTSKKNKYDDIGIFYNDHNSKINSIFSFENSIYSFGSNGKIYDYEKDEKQKERNVCLYKFKNCITCLCYLYTDNNFLFFCIGFNNGVIKVVKIKNFYLDIIYCLKTSNNKIIKIEKSKECEYICVISEEEPYIFFLHKFFNEFKPIGYLKITEFPIKNCAYLAFSDSFYLLGEHNYLFRINVQRLKQKCGIDKVQEDSQNYIRQKDEKNEDLGVANKIKGLTEDGISGGTENDIIDGMEGGLEEEAGDILAGGIENAIAKGTPGCTTRRIPSNHIQEAKKENDDNAYDVHVEYEIIKIQFNKCSYDTSSNYFRNDNKKKDLNGYNFSSFNKEDNNSTHKENDSDENEFKMNSSSSDLSEYSYNKMSFYRDKIRFTKYMDSELEIQRNNDDKNTVFENKEKKRNLQKYIEILFNKNVLSKVDIEKREHPFSLSINMERGKRKKEEKEEEEEEKKNKMDKKGKIDKKRKKDKKGQAGQMDQMDKYVQNYENGKEYEIRIRCLEKMEENKGFFLTTEGAKNNCIFFLNLNKKGYQKYNSVINMNPKIIFRFSRTQILPKQFIHTMIVNEDNHLLFCLSNNNKIYIFSTKHFFMYYCIIIPVYEKVRNIFVNKHCKEQYIFVCLYNKYIKLNFVFSFFHLFNITRRYHLNVRKYLQLFSDIQNREDNFMDHNLLATMFMEDIHDYIIEEMLKKKKKKCNLIPFTFEQVNDDITFLIQLFQKEKEINQDENKNKEKEKNDIMDIWNFIQKNNKGEKEEIEEKKKKINLLLNYDQKNLNTIFNLNNNVKDVDIQYSLRETKEAREKEENIKMALLYKKNIHMKIKKLKKKYRKLCKKKKFIVDIDFSYNVYQNLINKIREIKNFFEHNQKMYDDRIRYLSNTFLRLQFSTHPLSTLGYNNNNTVEAKCIKTYLKNNNKYKEFKKKKKKNKVNEYINKFKKLRQKNQKLKIINNEEKIEEICFKKKIIKMYENILSQMDKMNEQDQENLSPQRISSITEIIREYEESKRKLLNQINYIKKTFNEDFNSLKTRIAMKLMHLTDEILFLRDTLKKGSIQNEVHHERQHNGDDVRKRNEEGVKVKIKGAATNNEKRIDQMDGKGENQSEEFYEGVYYQKDEDKIKKYENIVEKFTILCFKKEKNTNISKISNINFNHEFFEKKYKSYDKEDIEYYIGRVIKRYDKEIHLLNIKRIEAIRIIKYITLKIISIDEKNNILAELRKKELKLRKQKKIYTKEMKIIAKQVNKYVNEMQLLGQELESHHDNREKIFDKLKQIIGENSLCYNMLVKSLKKKQDEVSNGSDKSSEEDGEDNSVIDIYNKEEIDRIKEENTIILNNINRIKKSIDNKKNEQRRLTIKKKSIEKEVEIINEEISIIEDDKKKSISEVKFYITLQLSKLRNIDYLYDKKKYRLNSASNCTILSREQYKDIMKKIEYITKEKEKFLFIYKSLKKENNELENVNNKLFKTVTDKKNALKNKLKKHDLSFDFNDLEKKYQEKKKKGILEEIKNKEVESNRRINIMNKELNEKTCLLNDARKENTALLLKISEFIHILKGLKNEES
ncbi:conserved Plasmodium protein, unknown function [Plasmodium malariae]|uniref:Uncharacterized protein n=1 Tax=Plasmodium malariae TaxID=5858 RepID=A0A1C3L146_PLAMA|nr:conserved Plasmodium protein, unknown function [Plasmodium malariae]